MTAVLRITTTKSAAKTNKAISVGVIAISFIEVLDFLHKKYETGVVVVPYEFHLLAFHDFLIRSRIPGRTTINNSPKTVLGDLPNDLSVYSLG